MDDDDDAPIPVAKLLGELDGLQGNLENAHKVRSKSWTEPTVLFTRAIGCSCLAAATRGSCSHISAASS